MSLWRVQRRPQVDVHEELYHELMRGKSARALLSYQTQRLWPSVCTRAVWFSRATMPKRYISLAVSGRHTVASKCSTVSLEFCAALMDFATMRQGKTKTNAPRRAFIKCCASRRIILPDALPQASLSCPLPLEGQTLWCVARGKFLLKPNLTDSTHGVCYMASTNYSHFGASAYPAPACPLPVFLQD